MVEKHRRVGPVLPHMGPDPNDYPNALIAEHTAAAAVTCQFLGKVFYEGDTICYQGGEWVCQPGGWAQTGNPC